MNWYLAKLVYRIICGDGEHTAQFDEQLRLISAPDEEKAFAKAMAIGQKEEDCFSNVNQQLVQWKFINIAELYKLQDMIDGAEIYSMIRETGDPSSFIRFTHKKAKQIQLKNTHQLLHLF
ncbi:MAG TPA: DUF4288 domain-containing protein [Chitinophagaceae bacterium]|nr:DUF4288 domain-containing protein [Chitinophagaceae bacterium]